MDAVELGDTLVTTTLGVWNAMWAKIVAFIPNLIGTAILVVVGLLAATLARRLGTAVLKRLGFDRAASRVGVGRALERAGIQRSAAELVGQVLFWLLMLTFLVSATESLGLPNLSNTIDAFVRYLPRVIGAALIVIAGMTLANFLRDLVRSGGRGLGLDYAQSLGNLVFVVTAVVVASLAVGQLQVETALFNRLIEIVLVAAGLALALALGLGTREIAHHVVAGVYLRDLYRPGMHVTLADREGAVQEVGAVATRLTTTAGRTVVVPNGRLAELVVDVREATADT